jgi:iron complex transport system substrate-binding protein
MKIVSLSPSTTEILFALGAGDMVVADTYFCDYPEEAKKLPKAGSFSRIEPENLAVFEPDLVFTSTVVQKQMADHFIQSGLNVVHFDPRSVDEIIDSIAKTGETVGKQTEAAGIISKMKSELEELQRTKNEPYPRVYIEEWYDPPMYSGNWVPELVELAGGTYFKKQNGDISKDTVEGGGN